MLTLRSTAFDHEASIPPQYTCEGAERSPPLTWIGVPPGTRSFALIVSDPDAPDPAAPKRTWIHWVLYNMPASATELPETATLPEGTWEGTNDWHRTGYGGPCPPIGRHRYYFRLYALDTILPDLGTPTAAQLEQAMKSHVLATAELMGTYAKRGGQSRAE